mmetsp:Transcript_1440/g.2045  ORF Transcript_1440/g.2045 Transcript_1440/m.2045 type:complete len:233 (+) Transcript_1440:432-1130(+)
MNVTLFIEYSIMRVNNRTMIQIRAQKIKRIEIQTNKINFYSINSQSNSISSIFLSNSIIFIGLPMTKIVIELILAQCLWLSKNKNKTTKTFLINSSDKEINHVKQPQNFTDIFVLSDFLKFSRTRSKYLIIGKSLGTVTYLLETTDSRQRYSLSSSIFSIEQAMYSKYIENINDLSEVTHDYKTLMYMQRLSNFKNNLHYNLYNDSRILYNANEACKLGIIDGIIEKSSSEN